MKFRLDQPFTSWGGFGLILDASAMIPGRLLYTPQNGITLELAHCPWGIEEMSPTSQREIPVIQGQLIDGTQVTLEGCLMASRHFGAGIGSPATITANTAFLGEHILDPDRLMLQSYTIELSSLSNWTGQSPLNLANAMENADVRGFDISLRRPPEITVSLSSMSADLRIGHGIGIDNESGRCDIHWSAGITIAARDTLSFPTCREMAWHCQNLMTLLIGDEISVRRVSINRKDDGESSSRPGYTQVVYQQIGRHDCKDLWCPQMLVPYEEIRDEFPSIVANWFSLSQQAVLARNVFFWSSKIDFPGLDTKFLIVCQAAESYHRSLGTGIYMQQSEYENVLPQLYSQIPDCIGQDHRASLKSRLKYGNEHSLRKRLKELLMRLPEDVRLRIAGDVNKFIAKVVDTRNYYTHYDSSSRRDAFPVPNVLVAAERIRILVVANFLHDLGIKDEKLLAVLLRNDGFAQWMSRELPL